MRRAAALGVIALIGSSASASSAQGAGTSPVAPPSRATGAVVAKIVVPTVVRASPGRGRVLWTPATRTPWGGNPHWLTVFASARDRRDREWLRVGLPLRPNGSRGWVRSDHVLLSRTGWWVDVSTGKRRVDVYRDGRLVRRFGAVVGAPATPTPHGLYALYDPIAQRPAGGFLGPWALHLTAFSTVLDDYGGGPGRVAIHGRGGASLRDPLGSARSHGCVRVANGDVVWLARALPPGTPVRIAS